MSRKMIPRSVLLAFEDGNNKRVIQKNVGQKNKSVVRQVFIFLVITHILREMNTHILSLRSRRQNRAWGGALAEPQVRPAFIAQARGCGRQPLAQSVLTPYSWGSANAPPQALCCRPHPRAKNASKCR